MQDYEIKIKRTANIELYGTEDGTVKIPDGVRFCTYYGSRGQSSVEMTVNNEEDTQIGLHYRADSIEISSKNTYSFPKEIVIKDIGFNKLELDLKGDHIVTLEYSEGDVDVNVVNGNITLQIESPNYKYQTKCFGKNTKINCGTASSSGNTIELNGKNGYLDIVKIRNQGEHY